MRFGLGHLAYCTNIHPAETWDETFHALSTHTMEVRNRVIHSGEPYAIGLRLSARAAAELSQPNLLSEFRRWLDQQNAYIFTINGFPYGDFHGTRVKEKVFQPDWTTTDRLLYTKQLFQLLAALVPPGIDGSVSTLPGSHKTFNANETLIFHHLESLSHFLDDLSETSGRDLHLGMEPEPLGHFENTAETLGFFERLMSFSADPQRIQRRIGINYDTCHFALQYEDAQQSLDQFIDAHLRISKIHLSSAISLNPQDPSAVKAISRFDEPIYFHQVIERLSDGTLRRHIDLPSALTSQSNAEEWRVHFHIPLDSAPTPPLDSTRQQVLDLLAWRRNHPTACSHYEIETYTWGVLPASMQRPVVEQIAAEYQWVLQHA